MIHQAVAWIVAVVGHWGYPGIVVLMALESSLFPFPSEVVIPPAAYLAASGRMSIGMVVLCGALGSLLGAVFNYWLALTFGRPFFERYGRRMLVNPESLARAERFFARHGHISTFTGRLLPVIRQYISLPAGLTRMNFPAFCAATVLGSGVWVLVLAGLGYCFGRNERLVLRNLHWATLALAVVCAAILLAYRRWWKGRQARNAERRTGV
ncbi:DedA family protein [Pseudodesulfovibrio methanolicus]|uniref:DedA family protein n=1 Tax=Pseudodesulfovibrio methanolicus TaxID=3126690 RepID=A0ABZ2IXD5_9BACT